MIPALVLAIASGAPPGYIKRAVVNPLLLATILWAVGHLLALGDLASLVLFGAFLLWSVVDWVMQPAGVSIAGTGGALRRHCHRGRSGPLRPARLAASWLAFRG